MAYRDGSNTGETDKRKLSRRGFLKWGLTLGGAAIASATGTAVALDRLEQAPPVKDPALADEDKKIRESMQATAEAKEQ